MGVATNKYYFFLSLTPRWGRCIIMAEIHYNSQNTL
ncbi:hypothetical protein WG66_003858 [Moniliophthora roreri]|nr:hypothetical protein WG66_003858 [Moniliophthora roreri]